MVFGNRNFSNENSQLNLLEVKDLCTYFYTDDGIVKAVDGVSFKVYPKKTFGIVGESGCGKSVTALSIMQLLPPPGKISEGNIIYRRSGKENDFIDICRLESRGKLMRSIRGKEIAMIFQEPMTSLNPVFTIGDQIVESISLHQEVSKKEGRERAIEMLSKVRFPNPEQRVDSYPHQLSGGLRQRAMIAMALSCNPYLLIADEPTTALDVTVQAQILQLMKQLQSEFQMAIIIITHNLGVIYEMSNETAVMYLGQVVEYANTETVLQSPAHPYTKALLKSIPVFGSSTKEKLNPVRGTVPDALNIGRECRFLDRCKEKKNICRKEETPPMIEVEENHWVRCWLYV